MFDSTNANKNVFCININRNDTDEATMVNSSTTLHSPPAEKEDEEKSNPIAEIQTGHAAEQQQQSESMKIFFILIVLGWCYVDFVLC